VPGVRLVNLIQKLIELKTLYANTVKRVEFVVSKNNIEATT